MTEDAMRVAMEDKPCSVCGEVVWWDETEPVLCRDCMTKALTQVQVAVLALEWAQQEWDRWRRTLPVNAFTHSDGLRFLRAIDAKLAALRAEGEGGR